MQASTRSCGLPIERSASLRKAPMSRDRKRATKSCQACVRFTSLGMAGAGVTSSYIASAKGGSSRSAESCTTRWTRSATRRFQWTRTADDRHHQSTVGSKLCFRGQGVGCDPERKHANPKLRVCRHYLNRYATPSQIKIEREFRSRCPPVFQAAGPGP